MLARILLGDVATTAYVNSLKKRGAKNAAPSWAAEQLVACIRDVVAAFRLTAGRFLLIFAAAFTAIWVVPAVAAQLESVVVSRCLTVGVWLLAITGHLVMAAYRARVETLFLNLEATGAGALLFAPYRIPRGPVIFIAAIYYLLAMGLTLLIQSF